MTKLVFLFHVLVATKSDYLDRYQVERRSMEPGMFEQLRQLVCMMDRKDVNYCE